MITTVVAVRHGETQWNKTAKQQGHLNSDLTELGMRQAEVMADGLRRFQFDFIFSSDLGRAVQTAQIVSGAIGSTFTTDQRLRERHLGVLQGLTKAEFEAKYPNDSKQMKSNDPTYRFPGGESIQDRHTRCVECAEDVVSLHPGKTILVVAHGGVLMSFMYKALQLPLSQQRTFSLFNGSINAFSISDDKQWNLLFWGDTSHLRAHGLDTLDDN